MQPVKCTVLELSPDGEAGRETVKRKKKRGKEINQRALGLGERQAEVPRRREEGREVAGRTETRQAGREDGKREKSRQLGGIGRQGRQAGRTGSGRQVSNM